MGAPGAKTDIDVGQRTTPFVVDWNNDGKRDLVVGAKEGLVRLYINNGTDASWDFSTEAFVQEDYSNLIVPSFRSSPHVMDLDGDGKKDLLAGNTNGQVLLYSNTGSDTSPSFSGYTIVEANGVPIDLAGDARSRPFVCDWDSDGRLDLLVGGSDGLVHLYNGVDRFADVRGEEQPPGTRLLAAWPNPFNPVTTISFDLYREGRTVLRIHDVSGRLIRTLVDETLPPGRHEEAWNGTDRSGRRVASGVYFYSLQVGSFSETRRLILLR